MNQRRQTLKEIHTHKKSGKFHKFKRENKKKKNLKDLSLFFLYFFQNQNRVISKKERKKKTTTEINGLWSKFCFPERSESPLSTPLLVEPETKRQKERKN